MDAIKWIIVANVFFAVLQFFLGLPLLLRKVPRNLYYGVRTATTLESDQRWYDINAYQGRRMIIWATIPVANALAGFFIRPAGSEAYLAASLALAAVAVLVPSLWALRRSRAH